MKRITPYLAVALLLLTSCKDELLAPLDFNVMVNNELSDKNLQAIEEGYKIPVGGSVNFLFEGNPDFISLQYSNFNAASATLSFDQLLSWNANNSNLRLYIAQDFPGLVKDNAKEDSVRIREYNWIDISHLVNFPQQKNDTTHTEIDMSAYRGDSIVFAFCYNTLNTGNKQPMFTISNMTLTSRTTKDNMVFNTIPASSMVMQPFDMLEVSNDSLAYLGTDNVEKKLGVWDVSFSDDQDRTAFCIRQVLINNNPNEDWLITRKLYIPRGKDDAVKTEAIKNYYLSVEDYTFTFPEEGEYTLVFTATNANYKQNERTTQTFKFIVYE
ncbi:MAG: DUF5017 domain-containing protein [Paludibacteraceae bacterium]